MHGLANSQLFFGTLQPSLFRENHFKRNASYFSKKMMKSTHNFKFPVTVGMAAFLSALKTLQRQITFNTKQIFHPLCCLHSLNRGILLTPCSEV